MGWGLEDTAVFEGMTESGLREYAQFLVWHYRSFAWEIDPWTRLACLFAAQDPHREGVFCKRRFLLADAP